MTLDMSIRQLDRDQRHPHNSKISNDLEMGRTVARLGAIFLPSVTLLKQTGDTKGSR